MSHLTSDEMKRLLDALTVAFGDDVSITTKTPGDEDTVPTTIGLTSPRFENLSHMARQERVWAVIEQVFGERAFEKIALVMAYAPSEFESASA